MTPPLSGRDRPVLSKFADGRRRRIAVEPKSDKQIMEARKKVASIKLKVLEIGRRQKLLLDALCPLPSALCHPWEQKKETNIHLLVSGAINGRYFR